MKTLAVLMLGLTTFAAQSFAVTSGECVRNPNVKGFPVKVAISAEDADTFTVQYQVADEEPQIATGVKRFRTGGDEDPQTYTYGFKNDQDFSLFFMETPGITIGWNLTVPGHKFIGHLHCTFR